MKIIEKILDTKYGKFIFLFFFGLAYFVIIMNLITSYSQNSGLIAFFFCPAIICGIALAILKMLRRLCDEERKQSASVLIYVHVALILISIVFLVDMFV